MELQQETSNPTYTFHGRTQTYEEIRRFKKSHALNRLFERCGITMSDEEYNNTIFEIEEYINKPILIRENDGKSFHIVSVGGTEVVFLYDWEFHCLLTVYYKSWFKQKEDGTWERYQKRSQAKFIRERSRVINSKVKKINHENKYRTRWEDDFDSY